MGYSPWGHKRVGHDLATKHTTIYIYMIGFDVYLNHQVRQVCKIFFKVLLMLYKI